jgi:hypothetical protein
MSEPLWRVGRSQPINVYYGGEYVAVAFGSLAIAAAIVARMNEGKPIPPEVGVDWCAVEEALEDAVPVHAESISGALGVLLARQQRAVDELEKFMVAAHLSDPAWGPDGHNPDVGFVDCPQKSCVSSRAKLAELRGYGG